MGTDVTEVVEKLPSPSDIKVHKVMCTELLKIVDRVDKIFPEIEAARPRCSSGIQSLCLLTKAIDKAKSLIRDCCESSKLYLALTGSTVLSRCKISKNLLEQSLSQIQSMVPVMLASKISHIIGELRRVKLNLDPSEEEAGKAVRSLLEAYRTRNLSEDRSDNEWIQIATQKLQITSQKALLIERRSMKKLVREITDGNNKQQKKQILLHLLDLLNKYGKSIAYGRVETDNSVQDQDYDSQTVDFHVDREKSEKDMFGAPPEEFKCPISLKIMYDPVIISSGQTFERMWIQKWFDEGHDVCPKTKRKLSNYSMIPNTAMKDLILKWCDTYGITVPDPFIQLPNHVNTWEHSTTSVNSLSSMYSLQLPVDYSSVSLSSLDNSRVIEVVENSREFDVELSQEIDDALPWEFQCKFVQDLVTRLKDDDQACSFIMCESLVGSLVKFLMVARDENDVKAQRSGCLLLLILVTKCRSIKYLSKDAYQLISEFLESEVTEEALAIIEELSSHEKCRSEIASSGSLTYIFKILDTQPREIQTRALKILFNLTSTRNVCNLIVSSELIPKLVTLSEDDDSVSVYCIAILTKLCGNPDNKSIIAETKGCISLVAKVLESEGCKEQEQASEILLSLCSQSIQYCRLVMDEGVIPSLVSISINGNDKGKAKALELLRLLRDAELEDYVEEPVVATVYDGSKDSYGLHAEKKTSSKASRIISKFPFISRTQKRKVLQLFVL
ncbi:putative U box domain, armadillo-like helical, Zinc finger, RING/FYVE/PHD-type [Helianthus annuus]|uniref:RING-type E3 ubiquitin transferase n=2 Tax=Helianthus annuus TaxID=4232 RepID=A0A251UAS1_HELAN|nr:putative U box domain, armadillo-like helical, Zinc finger, RING/FYVE/PHD-type [Helianthus annuus]KAJ0550222.1 putative U box domain, armadillo-like helical, Zinc finger, RING/FYVE/PHD-type [Helianthus annuus]KAJ0563176.1 putative U box domain, armadillo-like helical, Zinc finger, RING/FYVE/PHD-type [Helianthus annuus]KAJ0731291.1 putative U box domain, armadillo-like helical, Zinc finger, RING/FYVE/PHD-type [Helianthus annuus]KAJ0904759.1 putative U box domain, armadillo-like helical, Zinc 